MKPVVLAVLLNLTLPPLAPAQPRHQPGQFDFYVLSLSWSPEHCAARPDDRLQCAGPKPFAFVLHGLWPQYEKGYPESCSSAAAPDRATLQSMLDIMPSESLVRHEWSKHGTCDGTSAPAYFSKARTAFQTFKTPPRYQQPIHQVKAAPAEFKKALLSANPQLKKDQLAVLCNGRYLQEVRVCLTRDLAPRSCPPSVRDRCTVPELIVRPIR